VDRRSSPGAPLSQAAEPSGSPVDPRGLSGVGIGTTRFVASSSLLLVALVACSDSSTAPSARLPLPIESVEVSLMESQPVQVAVEVRGYVPDSCHAFKGASQRRDGNSFSIEMFMERTAPADAACLLRIEIVERSFPLGPLPAGDYVVNVNGVRRSFHID
jgi:hypothetical protein